MKDFDAYQDFVQTTVFYPGVDTIYYPVLGLCGEAGEVADKIKKIYRDKGGKINQEDSLAIAKELGDTLWYLARLAHLMGFKMSEVADINVRKLTDRKARNAMSGDGDNR